MGLFKDIYGAGCAAVITGGFFLGAPIIGLIYSIIPTEMIDVLVTSERPPVYFDGAYELSNSEVAGELDGTLDEDPPDDADPDADPTEKTGSEDSEGPEDPNSKNDHVGGEVAAEGVTKTGTRGGSRNRGGARKRPTGAKPAGGKKKKKSRRKCKESYDGIKKRRDGSYEVSRKLVNYHTASVSRFNELGWSKPNDKGDGKGWYVSGFGCNDALWHGGLRRGDVVLTVNGKKTNNMMQVLMLYSKVKFKKKFEVRVRRKGKVLTFRYHIVNG